MATILFAAAGAALGSTLGGSLLGLSGAVIGRAVGATVGRAVDQRIIGSGSEAVDVGRIDRLRITGASEGTAVAQVWGRMRMAGQVIWASPFNEVRSRRGGKGMPSQKLTEYSYTASLAIALCEGEILGVGRIWADGIEIQSDTISIRTYLGTETQLPDPIVEAYEGVDHAPAYRGIAYVVIESLDLSAFGNRVPQFSFEVIRRSSANVPGRARDLQGAIRGVAIIPGTGEYSYSAEKQNITSEFDYLKPVNVNTASGKSDFSTSLDQLQIELPNCRAASLVISWFGSDLRCEYSNVQPKVEQRQSDNIAAPWRSGGIGRQEASEIDKLDGRSVYGGTPADTTVIEAIREMTGRGLEVMFYPFVLMDQLDGNQLQDPYSGSNSQPKLPWRGRITLSEAPGRTSSPDGTSEAQRQVNAFFGNAQISDFEVYNNEIFFTGAQEWGYRRFVLHYAHLCRLAGGVESFCVGSELRGLTSIRGEGHNFPAVHQLLDLLNDVRIILGPNTKLSYAADWSEYFGYHIGNDVFFNLDLLWASPNVDFIGIDYYVPMSDWRHSPKGLDKEWGSQYNVDYIKSNILGGEFFEWYYVDKFCEDNQIRSQIDDGEWDEGWIFRAKDIVSWWSNYHYERVNGSRSVSPTGWMPRSKPYRFTEFGCAAVDLGANQPNKFLDANSSESSLPRNSVGIRDDLIQIQYYRALEEFWADVDVNPVSEFYHGRMLDQAHCYAWAWDARPFPDFPRNEEAWSDARNYNLGHWLNGRASSVPLDSVLSEICEKAGASGSVFDTVYGSVKGFSVLSTDSARSKIQPLSQLYSFDCVEDGGQLKFSGRMNSERTAIDLDDLVLDNEKETSLKITRGAPIEVPSSVRFSFIESECEFPVGVVEVSCNLALGNGAIDTEFPILLSKADAKSVATRWLAELKSSGNSISLSLPPSLMDVTVGALLCIDDRTYRVDRLEQGAFLSVEAIEVEQSNYENLSVLSDMRIFKVFRPEGPVYSLWLELPLFGGGQSAVSPFVAVGAYQFRGPAALWLSTDDSDYEVNKIFNVASYIGRSENSLSSCPPGIIDRGDELLVRMHDVPFSNISMLKLLSGKNLVCIGDGSSKNWEVFQFQSAELLPSGLWSLRNRLRGQFGSNSRIATSWPAGSHIVFLEQNISQANIPDELVGLDLHFRLGLTADGLSDPSTRYSIRSFDGVGLLPYQVCHFRIAKLDNQNHVFSWIRRSRLGGDSWQSYEIPLLEEAEQYSIRIFRMDDTLVREAIVTVPNFSYDYDLRELDGNLASYRVVVCQMSSAVGRGYPSEILVE